YRGPLRDILLRTGTRALLAIPMQRKDELIGGLTVHKKTPGAFAPEVIELLQTFATQSALPRSDAISALASRPAWNRLGTQRARQSTLRQEATGMVHVGVDLHKRMSQIAVLTADGERTQHRLPNDLAQLEPFFAQLPTPSPIAIEASGPWWGLVDFFDRIGH